MFERPFRIAGVPERVAGASPGEGTREAAPRVGGHHPEICAGIPGQEEVQQHAAQRCTPPDGIQGMDRQVRLGLASFSYSKLNIVRHILKDSQENFVPCDLMHK